jgi:hypothetical protein
MSDISKTLGSKRFLLSVLSLAALVGISIIGLLTKADAGQMTAILIPVSAFCGHMIYGAHKHDAEVRTAMIDASSAIFPAPDPAKVAA